MSSPWDLCSLKKKKMKKKIQMAIIHPNCCGIDVGSKVHHVATGLEIHDIKEYGVYTEDHVKLVKDLKEKKVIYVAMESTGSYWQTLFIALQKAGFKVSLVDGKQTKNYKNKTDYKDARAIYKLHSLGFLSSCFLPSSFTEKLRELYRYRSTMLAESSRYTNRMQKSLRIMNFRIDNILSDVMGKSGKAVIRAIIDGERSSKALVNLIDRRVNRSKKELLKGCEGQWDETQVYLLKDSYSAYEQIMQRITNLDKEIASQLNKHIEGGKKKGTKKQIGKNQINIGLQDISYSYYGVDLFAIESVSYNLVMTLISEVGDGMDKFSSSKEFCSWLRIAPNNKISGGKILSSKTPKGKNALAIALRNAANTISRSKEGHLQAFFRRIAYKKGRGAAITATARKLATIIWSMITKKEEYIPVNQIVVSEKIKERVLKNMKKKLAKLNLNPHLLLV